MSAAVDMLRRKRRDAGRTDDVQDEEVGEVPHRAHADDLVQLRDLQAQVEVALARLVPSRRMVVRMSLAGYDRQQIVDRLGWSDGKVRNLLSRGMDDLRTHQVDILALGQYLRPTVNHLALARWVTPEQFATYRDWGLTRGFLEVAAGPLVRSSYRAERALAQAVARDADRQSTSAHLIAVTNL